jgi:hypothetical protein
MVQPEARGIRLYRVKMILKGRAASRRDMLQGMDVFAEELYE